MMNITARKRSGFTLIELMIVIAIIAILAAILVPNFVRARGQGHLTACKSNLKNIGTACEMYSTDNSGRYPNTLSVLTDGSMGGYLKSIPTCPAAGTNDVYTSTYKVTTNPDVFTVACGGSNHTAVDVPANNPAYDSVQGLIERDYTGA